MAGALPRPVVLSGLLWTASLASLAALVWSSVRLSVYAVTLLWVPLALFFIGCAARNLDGSDSCAQEAAEAA